MEMIDVVNLLLWTGGGVESVGGGAVGDVGVVGVDVPPDDFAGSLTEGALFPVDDVVPLLSPDGDVSGALVSVVTSSPLVSMAGWSALS